MRGLLTREPSSKIISKYFFCASARKLCATRVSPRWIEGCNCFSSSAAAAASTSLSSADNYASPSTTNLPFYRQQQFQKVDALFTYQAHRRFHTSLSCAEVMKTKEENEVELRGTAEISTNGMYWSIQEEGHSTGEERKLLIGVTDAWLLENIIGDIDIITAEEGGLRISWSGLIVGEGETIFNVFLV